MVIITLLRASYKFGVYAFKIYVEIDVLYFHRLVGANVIYFPVTPAEIYFCAVHYRAFHLSATDNVDTGG